MFRKFLMNEAGENGSGGGAEAPAGEAASAPQGGINMDVVLAKLSGMMDQKLTAFRKEFQPPANQGGGPEEPEEPEDTSGMVDTATKQYVDRNVGAMHGTLLQIANMEDRTRFNQEYGGIFTKDEMAQIETSHGVWLEKGVTFEVNGKRTRPSRQDVAERIFGVRGIEERTKRGAQTRANGNMDATLETGSRSSSGVNGTPSDTDSLPKNYGGMSARQKADYHRKQLEEMQGGL